MRVYVYAFPREGIPSPEGAHLLERAKREHSSLFVGLRKGRVFELEVDTDDHAEARTIATEAAKKLLANPTIEEFNVVIP